MGPESIEIGRGLCYAGAGLAFGLAGAGSAWGIAIASHQAAGVIREKPELFGRMLVMIALPGTQGFYGFIAAILMMTQTGLIGGSSLKVTLGTGIAFFFIGLGDGIAQLVSAIKQGEASAAGISLLARRPEAAGCPGQGSEKQRALPHVPGCSASSRRAATLRMGRRPPRD